MSGELGRSLVLEGAPAAGFLKWPVLEVIATAMMTARIVKVAN